MRPWGGLRHRGSEATGGALRGGGKNVGERSSALFRTYRPTAWQSHVRRLIPLVSDEFGAGQQRQSGDPIADAVPIRRPAKERRTRIGSPRARRPWLRGGTTLYLTPTPICDCVDSNTQVIAAAVASPRHSFPPVLSDSEQEVFLCRQTASVFSRIRSVGGSLQGARRTPHLRQQVS